MPQSYQEKEAEPNDCPQIEPSEPSNIIPCSSSDCRANGNDKGNSNNKATPKKIVSHHRPHLKYWPQMKYFKVL